MHSNECDRCCVVIPSLRQLCLWRLRCFPHNCFLFSFLFFFEISPVNKLHLLRPTTHTPACTCTHKRSSRHPCKLTFAPRHRTKGCQGSSSRLIYLIWVASLYIVSHWGVYLIILKKKIMVMLYALIGLWKSIKSVFTKLFLLSLIGIFKFYLKKNL